MNNGTVAGGMDSNLLVDSFASPHSLLHDYSQLPDYTMATSGNRIMMFRDPPLTSSDPSETRISPPINAKCMMDKAIQVSPDHTDEGATCTGIIIHDTHAAQELNHSFQIKHYPASQPTPNRRSLENEEDIEHVEEIPLSSEVQTKALDMTGKESSYVTDRTDGTWLTEEDIKPDDSCGIKCLYYTMQCCACMIL